MNKLKNRIKEKIITIIDSDYLKKSSQKPHHVFIQNINKNYLVKGQKKALISYLTLPILVDLNKNIAHTNYREFMQILHIISELGYQIDICHYQDPNSPSLFEDKKYDLIIGCGIPYFEACKKNTSAKKILYTVVSYPKSQLEATIKRSEYFIERHNYKPNFFWHNYYPDDHFAISDHVFYKGNKKTLDTYPKLSNIKSFHQIISCPFQHQLFSINKRIVSKSRSNFIWFGSNGALRKGLDILIDVFVEFPNLKLTIAGLTKEDKTFLTSFTQNIEDVGFVDLHSEKFVNLMLDNSFVIFPSCSEGMASGLLTCMNHGLIPIISENCGIEVDDEIGYVLKDYKCETIKDVILKATKCSDQIIEKKHENILNYTQKNYNIEKYTEIIKSHLEEITL